jgi:hypothetical protein
MSEAPAKDPRFRPFRAASWALYLVVSVGFSSLIIYSVCLSVWRMTPARPPESPDVLTVSQCVAGARAFFEELDHARRTQSEGEATSADRRFLDFRNDWLTRKRRLEAECALSRPERADLKELLATLDRVMDLYTTSSVQFASALGPTVERFRHQLEQVK